MDDASDAGTLSVAGRETSASNGWTIHAKWMEHVWSGKIAGWDGAGTSMEWMDNGRNMLQHGWKIAHGWDMGGKWTREMKGNEGK